MRVRVRSGFFSDSLARESWVYIHTRSSRIVRTSTLTCTFTGDQMTSYAADDAAAGASPRAIPIFFLSPTPRPFLTLSAGVQPSSARTRPMCSRCANCRTTTHNIYHSRISRIYEKKKRKEEERLNMEAALKCNDMPLNPPRAPKRIHFARSI